MTRTPPLAVVILGIVAAGPVWAQPAPTDLRDLRVGAPVSTLQMQGYGDLHCVTDASVVVADWTGYKACPADAADLREIGFRYTDTPDGATKVAGQPMILSLFVGPTGLVQSIHMQTDPAARPYQHKRAYIFGSQVMARYGDQGWVCSEGHPSDSEQPVGGLFVREHCEKLIDSRHLVIDRTLFETKAGATTTVTNRSTFTVSLVKPNAT